MTTDNPIIIKGIEETNTIVCVQKGADKKIPNEEDFIKSNKMSFGSEIGSITNYITSMFGLQAKFEQGTKEWDMLDYRIKCGQLLQQNSIDKAKGVVSKPMPKHWYNYRSNKILEEDSEIVKAHKEFNLRIMADKKPYFFNYVYPMQMKKYKDFLKKSDEHCLCVFNTTVSELRSKTHKTEEEIEYLKYYDLMNPCEMSSCTMNKVAWIIENEFDGITRKMDTPKFDYTIMKSGVQYSKARYSRIEEVVKEYAYLQQNFYKNQNKEPLTAYELRKTREMFKEQFKEDVREICSNEQELCEILLDICYKKESSKQLVWDACDEQIVINLLANNNNTINYMTLDENGDTMFNGYGFTMKQKILECDSV